MSKDPATAKDPVLEKLDRALALEQQGKKAEAIRAAKKIWEDHKSHPASLQAATLWTRLEEANPVDGIYAMCVSYVLQGKFNEAIQGTELITKMKPDHAQAWATMAIAVRSLGDLPRALELNNKAVSLDKKNLSGWTNRVDIYCDQGEFEKGIEACKEALKLFPNDGGLHSNIARMYSRVGKHDEAVFHFRKVTQLSPDKGGLLANYLGHLREFRIDGMQDALTEKCYKLFEKSISEQRMYPMAWLQVKYMHALMHNKRIDENDFIVDMQDMEKISDEYRNAEAGRQDKSRMAV
jgi:tetratricopeptide (TPR) repeat protein